MRSIVDQPLEGKKLARTHTFVLSLARSLFSYLYPFFLALLPLSGSSFPSSLSPLPSLTTAITEVTKLMQAHAALGRVVRCPIFAEAERTRR